MKAGGTIVLELIASVVVHLSDQTLTAYNAQQQPVRARARSSPSTAQSPCGDRILSPQVFPGRCASRAVRPSAIHAAPWQEQAGQSFGVPRSHGAAFACPTVPPSGCLNGLRKEPQSPPLLAGESGRVTLTPLPAQRKGGSPGCPCRGAEGGSHSGGRGPTLGRSLPRSRSQASSQLTAVARRVRRATNSEIL